MDKIRQTVKSDLWVILLDIFAVNFAYYLALLLRGAIDRVASPGGAGLSAFMSVFYKFAPVYTVLCLVVFFLFRLYGGLWRYAGINDMNRIIGASVVTCLLQVAGTWLFFRRMPVSYYGLGAAFQFLFVSAIRFGYRIVSVEREKLAKRSVPTMPTLIIGAGETGRRAMKHLEDHTAFKPVVVLDKGSAGRTLDGIPVVDGDLAQLLTQYHVMSVCIADSALSPEARKQIRETCAEKEVELQDFTGHFANLAGAVPLTALLELARGPVTVTLDGQERRFASGDEALRSITGRYDVAALDDLRLELRKPQAGAAVEAWMKEYKEATGEEISFF